jgi:N-acetylglutamate synthase-like GNAT family acetyltransferase
MEKVRELSKEDKGSVEDLFSADGANLLWNFESFIKHPDCFGVVLEINKRIVGFGSLIRYITPRHGLIGRLEDILVHPNFREGGLGKLIIDRLIALGEEFKLKQIVLTSNPKRDTARHIYLSRGFILYKTGVLVKNI